ncbi:hypothetical protein RJT34_30980 [Clitoria ternatea]|uniref:Uncharacterized protein n=1 Tax=Clitoria ternatea TaxID=43366 RepID=A0AAN9EU59_CLITE
MVGLVVVDRIVARRVEAAGGLMVFRGRENGGGAGRGNGLGEDGDVMVEGFSGCGSQWHGGDHKLVVSRW